MIIGIVESGEARLYRDTDAMLLEWRNYLEDLISGVITLYTESGQYLEPLGIYGDRRWYQPRRKLTGVQFLERAPAEAGEDDLGYLLRPEVTHMQGNPFFSSLEELRKRYPAEDANAA